METISINYKELKDTLESLDKSYPSRIYWQIDLLKANINDKLIKFLSWDNIFFEIDNENKLALLWWKEIEWSVYAICDFEKKPTSSEKMYEQIIKAKEQAKRLWIYEKVFIESNDEKNKIEN